MKDQFYKNGFSVAHNVLTNNELNALRKITEQEIDLDQNKHLFPRHGSMIRVPYWKKPLNELIASERLRSIWNHLELNDTRWMSGYIISKPPGCPSLWWHQDWWAWDEAISYESRPPQVFVMIYLTSTTELNGALRVIPGSHIRHHELHEKIPTAHSKEINSAIDSDTAHAKHADEITLPVQAGDIVIGDSRLLHATHANNSGKERTCITLWFAPFFSKLPETIQAKLTDQLPPSPVDHQIPQHILPEFEGTKPATLPYNRNPDLTKF